jgi:hypothetical protein
LIARRATRSLQISLKKLAWSWRIPLRKPLALSHSLSPIPLAVAHRELGSSDLISLDGPLHTIRRFRLVPIHRHNRQGLTNFVAKKSASDEVLAMHGGQAEGRVQNDEWRMPGRRS